MDTLFPLPPPRLPEGFQYFPDFISREEENKLLDLILTIPLHTFIFQGYEARRRVASFGYDWNFTSRKLSLGAPIPEKFHELIKRTGSRLFVEPKKFAELLLTEYPPGSVINWHRDAPPFDLIAGISLKSDCTFRFRPYDKSRQTRSSIITLPVKRCSLYVLKGASRTDWEHSIVPVKSARYSITLRTLR